MSMNYKHTQTGYLIIFTLLAVILLFGWIMTQDGFRIATGGIMLVVLLILSSFLSLTVEVDKNNVNIKFGYGIFKKQFERKEINSVTTVKNHWYYGWGIRVWFWPRMFIFNISGFDAVEIKMKNGRIFRIGTDEPRKLKRAIQEK